MLIQDGGWALAVFAVALGLLVIFGSISVVMTVDNVMLTTKLSGIMSGL